jgi:transketolase
MAEFAKEFPRRFINVGVAEQLMIGMAAGLALKGLRPFCYTIATFALYRPFEFVRDDLAYQKLPVTVVGMGAGLQYSSLGGTHQAIEDVAIASAIPGMQVLAPCDPLETEECVRWCAAQQNGPVYLRLGKAGEPNLTADSAPWEFCKPRILSRRVGLDQWYRILTYGPIASLALKVGEILDRTVVNFPTLKPMAWKPRLDSRREQRDIVIEEHVRSGGLGEKLGLPSFCLKDKFIHFHGSREQLLELHGLTVKAIVDNLRH